MPRTLTDSDRSRADLWLDLIESGDWTTAGLASMTGLDQRTIQRRIRDARARRDERGDDDETNEIGDVPVMYLSDRFPGSVSYDCESGAVQPPDLRGPVLVPRSSGNGLYLRGSRAGRESDDVRKSDQTAYRPDPELSGGLDGKGAGAGANGARRKRLLSGGRKKTG
jgi:hypothetical protein